MENLTSGEQMEGITPANQQLELYDLVWKCQRCGQIFPDYERFIKHSNRFDQEDMRDEAGNNLITEKMSMAVILSSYACEFCDARFSEISSLLNHEARHTCSYECKFCNEGFGMLKTLLEHRAQCSEYINCWISYQWSVRVMYSCNVCTDLFSTLPELYNHRYSDEHFFPRRIPVLDSPLNEFDELWYICEICGYFCKRIFKLLQHRKKHVVEDPDDADTATLESNTRRYLCEKCGKLFKSSSNLHQHLRFHRPTKPFACTVEGCMYRSAVKGGLTNHIQNSHIRGRTYECEECHKLFGTAAALCAHRPLHRKERPFHCDICGSRFTRIHSLRSHMRLHTGEKPFECMHCGLKYSRRADCTKHERVMHPN